MIDPHNPMQARPSGEILSLATLDVPEAIRQLTTIGERFGKVRSVLLLPKLSDAHQNHTTFLVNFETGADASRAAQALNFPLYGYTTVIVAVPKAPVVPEPRSAVPGAPSSATKPEQSAMDQQLASSGLSAAATTPTRAPAVPAAPRSKHRSLLALDGQHLSRDLLKAAQAHCLQLSNRVDILLTNPPAAPTSVLCELLIGLEKAGVDYRLTVAEGSLSHLVSQYLRRFLGITLIMVAASQSLGSDWRARSAHYSQQGYRLVTLQESPASGDAD